MKSISTCLWFDHQAEEAAQLYTSVFEHSKIGSIARYGDAGSQVSGQKAGSVMTVEFQLENLKILGLNGGPEFKFTPALSFFVSCSSESEIDEKWRKLSQGGSVRMELSKYPWAEKYGWTSDRYGVEWQLILAPREHKIAPAFLFVDKLFGKGQEALDFYMSLFPNSNVESIHRDEATNSIMHAAFTLGGQGFALMEGQGNHGFTFSHATSLMVYCESQSEIDHYWNKLSEGGSTEPCGWLQDKFGVSWQIVPTALGRLMSDSSKAEKVMQAMLKMKKLNIADLENAAR